MKKKKLIIIAIIFLLAITFKSSAQSASKIDNEAIIFTGQVAGWVYNDDYVYDGFNLQINYKMFLVKFPPNKGNQLTMSVNTGTTISVKGFEIILPKGNEIKMIGITANGKNIYDSINIIPIVESQKEKEYITSEGKISKLLKYKNGKLKSIVLDNNIVLRLPTNFSKQLINVAMVGTNIYFDGVKHISQNGEVIALNYTIVNCEKITINGKKYSTE